MKFYAVKDTPDVAVAPKEWTNDYILILNKLLQRESLYLFEKESLDSLDIRIYSQFSTTDVTKFQSFREIYLIYQNLTEELITKDSLRLFDGSIIGHEKTHAQRVAYLSAIFAALEGLHIADILILLTSVIVHDVGRSWENLSDAHHGEKSFEKFSKALGCNRSNIAIFAKKLNSFTSRNFHQEYSFNIEDCSILKHIVSIHSLDIEDKKMYCSQINISDNKRFIELSAILDDSDALDRIRFRNNLNINYLNTPFAKRLIHFSKVLNEGADYE